jgi:hypothetical protein
MLSINLSLKLGYQLNLIKGIKGTWDTQSGEGSPFFAPQEPSQLNPQVLPDFDPKSASFSDIKVSFHYSWRDLIEAIYGKWNITDQELCGNTNTFILKQLAEENIKSNICDKLGIKRDDIADDAKVGFALVMVTKSVVKGSYNMDEPELISKKLSEEIVQLPKDTRAVAPFLSFFNSYGTHYISFLEIGDIMYQVFIYEDDDLKEIENKYETSLLSGQTALSFQQYTEPKSKYGGFSKYAGVLNLASEDTQFESMKEHFKDEANWVDCSIFIAIKKEKSSFLNQLTYLVPISCNLMNFSSLIYDKDQQNVWTYIFRNTLYQKYGRNINSKFPSFACPYNYKEIYKTFQRPFVSTISTSCITLSQIWLNLDDFVTNNPENVTQLFVFADIIEISKDIKLPGNTVTIICRKFISHTQSAIAPVIELTNEGYENFNFYCQEFEGVAEVRRGTSDEHKLIACGQAFKTTKVDEQTTVVFDKSHTINPPIEILRLFDDRTLYTLGCPLQSAQSIMNYPVSNDAVVVAGQFTQWLADILEPSSEDDPDMVSIRAQALLRLKSKKNQPNGILSVPYLTFDAYKPAIDAMMNSADAFDSKLDFTSQLIQTRKSEERAYEDKEELNKNIQLMGKFLIEQNKALADKERDVEENYKKINDKQESMLKEANDNVDDLKKKLDEQIKVINDAGDTLKGWVAAYIAEQEIKAVIQLAGGIASLFAGGAGIYSIDKMEKIKKIMTIIDAAMKFIDAASKLYESIDGSVHTICKSVNTFVDLPNNIEMPTALEWNEYDAEVYSVFSPILAQIPYANIYLKESKILSARGRAYLDAASQVTKIQYDKLLYGWQKDVSQKQADRLDKLNNMLSQPDLSPSDVDKIDLFELGSIYQSHLDKVVLQMVKTLSIQDAALQYYYLQAPSPITSYDVLSLKETIVSQAENSITSLESFPSKPSDLQDPYVYTLKGVKVSQLVDDKGSSSDSQISKEDFMQYSRGGYKFTIPLDVKPLFNYVRVRIKEIRMKIEGIRSTDSGKVNVRLVTSANPFCDRGLNRESIEFTTIQQDFEYVYDLKTGYCVYTNKPSGEFAKYFMKMTPFTEWRISLPTGSNSENAGIEFFGDTVDITLSFYVQAIRLSAKELNAFKNLFLAEKCIGVSRYG